MTARIYKTHSLMRLETFTDAVYAVVMTVLVLDLRVPEVTSAVTERRFDYTFLSPLIPRFIGLVVSFLMLASSWYTIITNFRRATKANRKLIWLVLVHLLSICIVPWGTALWSEHPLLPQACVVYSLVTLGQLVTGSAIHHHCAVTFFPDDPVNRLDYAVNVAIVTLCIVNAIMCAFVSVYLGFAGMVIGFAAYTIPRSVLQRWFAPTANHNASLSA